MSRFTAALRALLAIAALGSAALLSPGCGEATGLSLPDMSFRDLDGKALSLSDFEGKAVLLNFWFLG